MSKTLLYLIIAIIIVAIVVLIALSYSRTDQAPIVGGDKDERGCVSSAGYSWCESSNECERPFEKMCVSDVDTLVAELNNASNINLTKKGESKFTWNLGDGNNFGDTEIVSVLYESSDVRMANYTALEKYIDDNYGLDINNIADGVRGGLRGFYDGYKACVFLFNHNKLEETKEGLMAPVGDSLTVKFECGFFNQNSMPQIMAKNAVERLLATKYKRDLVDVHVTVNKFDESHLVGSVKFGSDMTVAGGIVMAYKNNGNWELIFDGNGAVDCDKIKTEYMFPADSLVGICD